MPSNENASVVRFWYARAVTPGILSLETKLSLLPAAQQAHFHTLSSERRKRQYLYSRLLLCSGLSQLFTQPTQSWVIQESENAAPRVTNLPDPHVISLSHSQDFLCFAMYEDSVGVDVELMKARDNLEELAALFMDEAELAAFTGEQHKSAAFFYKLWCAKEACYKALKPEEQQTAALSALSYAFLRSNDSPWQLTESIFGSYCVALLHRRQRLPATLHSTELEIERL
ncbi:4'-phosphopantetheinyl transferase family protein [Pokkaliibacter sp. CJK22405]|uniref:4'-phosphopantetheinyl transferase family protein n=1 Tax=Pokkaliibacter sp. CJK22405 TaxID=3384615 RepID=UPI003984FC07